MINILNNSIPVVKAVPEVKTEGKVSWVYCFNLCIETIHSWNFALSFWGKYSGFNSGSNIWQFFNTCRKMHLIYYCKKILVKQVYIRISKTLSNKRNGVYLLFDPVHLLENVRNNLINSRKFVFSTFKFDDPVSLEGGEITWKLLHGVFDKDENMQPDLKKSTNYHTRLYTREITNKTCL